MSKGAKQGQNRFERSQKAHHNYRTGRIKDEVIPKLKTYTGKINFSGITPFSRFCSELYNTELPANEKPIGYRTFVQNEKYWALIGPIYYKYWDKNGEGTQAKEKLLNNLALNKASKLSAEVERLKLENEALRTAIKNYGVITPSQGGELAPDRDLYRQRFDRTCRAMKLIIDATDGMFKVDEKAIKIMCEYNDLEPDEGLVPRLLAKPYVEWLKSRIED